MSGPYQRPMRSVRRPGAGNAPSAAAQVVQICACLGVRILWVAIPSGPCRCGASLICQTHTKFGCVYPLPVVGQPLQRHRLRLSAVCSAADLPRFAAPPKAPPTYLGSAFAAPPT